VATKSFLVKFHNTEYSISQLDCGDLVGRSAQVTHFLAHSSASRGMLDSQKGFSLAGCAVTELKSLGSLIMTVFLALGPGIHCSKDSFNGSFPPPIDMAESGAALSSINEDVSGKEAFHEVRSFVDADMSNEYRCTVKDNINGGLSSTRCPGSGWAEMILLAKGAPSNRYSNAGYIRSSSS